MADPVDPQMQPPSGVSQTTETIVDELGQPRFSLTKFKEHLARKGGLARGQYFNIRIVAEVAQIGPRDIAQPGGISMSGSESFDAPGQLLLAHDQFLTCRAATVPQYQVQTTEFAYFSRTMKRPSSRTFEPFTATFLHTNDPGLRKGFERWIDSFNLSEANQSVREIPLATIVLVHYDMGGRSWLEFLNALRRGMFREDRVVGMYKLIGAFPTSVSGLQFSHDAGDDIQTYDVTFDYQYMTTRLTADAL